MRWLILMLLAAPAWSETVVPTRTLRAQTVLAPQDLTRLPVVTPGAIDDPALALGQEARVTLYAGRPIRPEDLGPPAIVARNQIVTLSYDTGRLAIAAEGRALSRGGVGDLIRVMNLASRSTVTGRVRADGTVAVH